MTGSSSATVNYAVAVTPYISVIQLYSTRVKSAPPSVCIAGMRLRVSFAPDRLKFEPSEALYSGGVLLDDFCRFPSLSIMYSIYPTKWSVNCACPVSECMQTVFEHATEYETLM